jgi:hypothetical protein
MSAYTQMILKHISSKNEVSIPVRINNFIQDVKPSFSSTEVYARMDPIFTYQNTKRTFQLSCEFVLYNELTGKWGDITKTVGGKTVTIKSNIDGSVIGAQAMKDFANKCLKLEKAAPGTGKERYAKFQTRALSSIYRFMYPLYLKTDHGNDIITRQLKGPPLLRITVPGVLNPTTKGGSLVFVPENFTVSTGLAAAAKQQFSLTSPDQMSFLAPRGAYGFTLGGTILHEDAPPAFELTDGNIQFTDQTFPFGTKASYSEKDLLK